jgi:hypothetical protein
MQIPGLQYLGFVQSGKMVARHDVVVLYKFVIALFGFIWFYLPTPIPKRLMSLPNI